MDEREYRKAKKERKKRKRDEKNRERCTKGKKKLQKYLMKIVEQGAKKPSGKTAKQSIRAANVLIALWQSGTWHYS